MPPLRLPDLPDMSARRRLLLLALGVLVVVGVALGLRDGPGLAWGYGDTDDAMRLVLARQLLHGRGWWDQREMILQPPVGVYMHWSRLLDGGIALMERGFGLFVSEGEAETLTRLVWPLMWVFPAAVAVLLIARRFAETIEAKAWPLWIAAVFLATYLPLYAQFRPGRVDHHDVQMVFFLLAFAGAIQPRDKRWGPALAGVASGLGLAIGLEALVFQAAIGAAMALRFAFLEDEAERLKSYGLGLAAATLAAFLIQTASERWAAPACDALAINLVIAIVVAGLGLFAAGRFTAGRDRAWRLGALTGVGALTLVAYLGLDPNCVHGPFADVDPRIKPFWLNYVQEVSPFPLLLQRKPEEAIGLAAPCIMGLLAWAWLGRRPEQRTGDWMLAGVLMAMTTAAGFVMIRAAGYAEWIAVALVAVAAADLAWRYRKVGALAPLMAALLFTPLTIAGAGIALRNAGVALMARGGPAKTEPKPPEDRCFSAAAYRDLAAARPMGLAAGDIDFGPFVLIHTPHATLSAPYHRMNWGIMAARGVLIADADDPGPTGAEAKARALGIGYVLECKAHRINADRVGLSTNSLQYQLDHDDWPDWLELISAETAPIRVFRVLPPDATPLKGHKG